MKQSIPSTWPDDLDRLRGLLARNRAGELSDAELRAHRVPAGVYEQRTDGTFMLRIRCPGGRFEPDAMRAVARISRAFGSGVVHATTRQEVQIHDVAPTDIHPALVALWAAGLSTKGGGGNTVRNVVACEASGVCPDEVFPVAPWAEAVSSALLEDPASVRLPRKFKVAFSGCPADCAGAAVADVGLLARRVDGPPGFEVRVGGGLGARSRVADVLEPFVPAASAYAVVEAVKRVFDRHGDRRNRQRARLRFLVEDLGLERFRELYREERARVEAAPSPHFVAPGMGEEARSAASTAAGPVAAAAGAREDDAFVAWRRRSTSPQRQPGRVSVHVHLRLGDVEAATLERLADVVAAHGEGTARLTNKQNLVLREVPEAALSALHDDLDALGLASAALPVVQRTVACAGASTCKLGMCLSRGLADAAVEALEAAGLDLEAARDLDLGISGCPNSCGRHPVASIGLSGAARRRDGVLVPYYQVHLGGRTGAEPRLGRTVAAVPARKVPELLVELLTAFRASPVYPDFHAFVDGEGAGHLIRSSKRLDATDAPADLAVDFGAKEPFSLAGRGPGECGAGVFDLIELDLESAGQALAAGRLSDATVSASRALLVTRGHDVQSAREALEVFLRELVEPGFVARLHRPVVETALRSLDGADFIASEPQVRALVEAVRALYAGMDASLRLPAPENAPAGPESVEVSGAERGTATEPATQPASEPAATAEPAADAAAEPAPDQEADLTGVVCPLNYVKTKMILERMAPGRVLLVRVSAQGARNVPESVSRDGHQVLSVKEAADGWRILVRRV